MRTYITTLQFTLRFALGSILFVTLFATASMAQNNATFVSGTGSDSNPCSMTLPCRTFDQALSVTNTGGVITVLTSAVYAPFDVNKGVSVIAPAGVWAGITPTGSSDAIDINTGPNDTVILRGLTVNNAGSSGSGIVCSSGGALHIESCVVSGFSNQTFNNYGIWIKNFGKIFVTDTIARCNYIGILIAPVGTGTASTAYVSMDHLHLDGNVSAGLYVNPSGSGAEVTAAIRDSSASGNGDLGMAAFAPSSATAALDIESCLITNDIFGLVAESTAAVSISNCTISRCTFGYNNTGGAIYTRGQNTIIGNQSNVGSLTPIAGQ